ncbi:glycosyltransferase family 9 protein [Azohydromonas caseinilytica]|uniref:Glycosyltransferase family 9 protein n=1 Tax=Azohydromonas caseinilytica TaxID=2728836 RepID=A0A848F598_9BURK|nr:glycosyltransferase family 9 protein [Azohydromonas caseinilytica]NML13543.1 glycosyltransferase family 9 protein [Azohydromonas caseinilytica]
MSAPCERQRRWQSVKRVLAVRLDNLGDLLMTTPALVALRASLPQAHITLLASRAGAALASHVPVVDEVLAFDAPWVKRPDAALERALEPGQAEERLIEALKSRRFDAAVIFTVCTQSALPAALLCLQAGIPLRLAYSRENPYELLTDWVPDTEVPSDGMRHEAQRQLDLVHHVGLQADAQRLMFRFKVEEALTMRHKFECAGGDLTRPYIVVHPGATAASRRWPAERFGQAAQALVDATGCQAVFSGGPDELPLVEQAMAAMRSPAISLAGQLSLGELASLIAGAQVTLCNNSAPAHLAAALDAPVVVLYALTNPQHTPWQARARVLNHPVPCRHCLKSVCPERHHDCLERVPPQEVAQAALELMGTLPGVPLHPASPCIPHPVTALG